MLDIFNRKVKIVNEELRKQIEVLEEENAGLKFYKIKTNNEIRNLDKEIKVKEGALDISIKAGVEKDKEIAKLKNKIKEIEKNKNSDKRILIQRVFAITPQNIETFRMLRGMALNGRNKRIRNKYINKMADSMEAIFKVITEQSDEITE